MRTTHYFVIISIIIWSNLGKKYLMNIENGNGNMSRSDSAVGKDYAGDYSNGKKKGRDPPSKSCTRPRGSIRTIIIDGCIQKKCELKQRRGKAEKSAVWVRTFAATKCCSYMKKGYKIGQKITEFLADDDCNTIKLICSDKNGYPKIAGSVENKCTNNGIFRAKNESWVAQGGPDKETGVVFPGLGQISNNETEENYENIESQMGTESNGGGFFFPGFGQTIPSTTKGPHHKQSNHYGRQCGVENRFVGNIIGGWDVRKNKYPWQVIVTLWWRTWPLCGGSIISPRLILTAAHCTRRFYASMLRVIVGAHDWTAGDGEIRKVKRKWEHDKYNRYNMDYDFALLELSEKLFFRKEVQMICLPPAGTIALYDDNYVTVAGWGTVDVKKRLKSATLKEVVLKSMSNKVCSAGEYSKRGYPKITPQMICATAEGKGSCHGDSGGPVTVVIDGYHYQIGVVSWGIMGCVQEGAPSVFARVTSLVDSLHKMGQSFALGSTKIGKTPKDF